ncbi:hypothetical protein [Dongia mobilis]|uniref:winged helix domain-containing protein n=1 Tax=Dongia sp. TaxID=1977262 RepID=UPI0026F06E05
MTARTFKVEFSVISPSGTVRGVVRGQTAKALLALVKAGPRGVTAMEAATWAYRLAAYCHDLRKNYGLVIRTDREDHDGGWHGRHVLESEVHITAGESDTRELEAA